MVLFKGRNDPPRIDLGEGSGLEEGFKSMATSRQRAGWEGTARGVKSRRRQKAKVVGEILGQRNEARPLREQACGGGI